jgi:hypothetical protein
VGQVREDQAVVVRVGYLVLGMLFLEQLMLEVAVAQHMEQLLVEQVVQA